eukprot:5495536-Pyramimonas_sp.AAC.1
MHGTLIEFTSYSLVPLSSMLRILFLVKSGRLRSSLNTPPPPLTIDTKCIVPWCRIAHCLTG